MSITNGIIQVPISIDDIHDALGASDYNTDNLFGGGYINKWSKFKPNSIFAETFPISSLVAIYQAASKDSLSYSEPEVNHDFDDFEGYYNDAISPLSSISYTNNTEEQGSVAFGPLNTPSNPNNNVTLEDLFGTSAYYIVIYKSNKDANYTFIERDSGYGVDYRDSYTFNGSDTEDITYTGCIAIAKNGSTNTCIAYPNSQFSIKILKPEVINPLDSVGIAITPYTLEYYGYSGGYYNLYGASLRLSNGNSEAVTVSISSVTLADYGSIRGNTTSVSIASGSSRSVSLGSAYGFYTDDVRVTITITSGGFSKTTTIYLEPTWRESEPAPDITIDSITINGSTSMEVDDTITLTATVSPSNYTVPITWRITSGSSYATIIDYGNEWCEIRGDSAGTVTVRAEGTDAYDTHRITISEPAPPPTYVESITLSDYTVQVEDSITLVPGIRPSGAIYNLSWSTSGLGSYAYFSNGTVTGRSPGSFTVTVKDTYTNISASCTVTVVAKPEPNIFATVVLYNDSQEYSVRGTVSIVDNNGITTSFSGRVSVTLQSLRTGQSTTISGISINSSGNGSFSHNSIAMSATEIDDGYVTVTSGTYSINGSFIDTSNITAPSKPMTGVSISESLLSFTSLNSSTTISASYVPSNATNINTSRGFTWSISDSSVATISSTSGTSIRVTSKTNGSATITVKGYDTSGNEFTDTCSVRVSSYIPVTSVSLNRTSLTIEEGQSDTLTATVYPTNAYDRTVSWSSTNPSIATVDSNGNVTAISPNNGDTCYIRASSNDNSNIYAECSITVTAYVPPAPTQSVTVGLQSVDYAYDKDNGEMWINSITLTVNWKTTSSSASTTNTDIFVYGQGSQQIYNEVVPITPNGTDYITFYNKSWSGVSSESDAFISVEFDIAGMNIEEIIWIAY